MRMQLIDHQIRLQLPSCWPRGLRPEALLATLLRVAMAKLPPTLAGAPSQPLEAGRASRVITPPNAAPWSCATTAVCSPTATDPTWCEGHHLVHWRDGGPTDLANLALLCRTHHRAVHEGGRRLERDPDGHLTATPPQRRRRSAAA